MGMWDPTNCETCDGGLRPWGRRAPNGGEVSLYEESPVDVGNRYGVLGAGFANTGLGDDGEDDTASDTNIQSTLDAVGPDSAAISAQGNSNPGETPLNATTLPMANAATGSNSPGGTTPEASTTTTTTSSGISTDASTSDSTPYVIGGLALAAVGGLGYYLYRRHKKARR